MLKRILTFGMVVIFALALAVPALAQDGGETDGNFFCENPDTPHPVVERISERYEVPYEETLGFFCGGKGDGTETETGFGLGEIMLAYETSLKLGDGTTAGDLLEMKEEMGGWGEVWQSLGLIGPEHQGPPPHAGPKDKSTPPDVDNPDTDPPEQIGPPDHAGPKDKPTSPDKKGPPDHAGPKDKSDSPAGKNPGKGKNK